SHHFYFFFFQAEDGIRERNVTGVQTFALPILPIHEQSIPIDAICPASFDPDNAMVMDCSCMGMPWASVIKSSNAASKNGSMAFPANCTVSPWRSTMAAADCLSR